MTVKCDDCGTEYGVGGWPFCKGGHGLSQGMLGAFPERWDEHIAPPPSEAFRPLNAPEYCPRRGWRIGTLADKKRLMRLNRVDER